MKTNATEENIVKYFSALKKLEETLDLTSRISMMKFSENNNLSKNLSTVLRKGKVIKCLKKGRFSEWEWITIKPTREMAIKTLIELGKENPERNNIDDIRQMTKEEIASIRDRKKETRGGARVGAGRKTKAKESEKLEGYTIKTFFGLIKINVKLNYK